MKICLIDDGQRDNAPGLVKEITLEGNLHEAFDMIQYTDKFGQQGYYVLDIQINNDIIVYKLVTKVARISEKK